MVSQHALQVSGKGGVYSSMPCRFPGAHTRRELEGSVWGGGRVLQAHTPGGEGVEGFGRRGLQAPYIGAVSRPTPVGVSPYHDRMNMHEHP